MNWLINSTTFSQWILIPFLIFLARVFDMSLDTIRVILLSKGNRSIAPFLGFLQVLIWLIAIRHVLSNLSNVMCYIAFAGGFATGTYVGAIIEERLAIGVQLIRIITHKDSSPLVNQLRKQGYGVTNLIGEGMSGKVNVIYLILKRVEIPDAINAIKTFNPNAFYTIEDVRSISQGFI